MISRQLDDAVSERLLSEQRERAGAAAPPELRARLAASPPLPEYEGDEGAASAAAAMAESERASALLFLEANHVAVVDLDSLRQAGSLRAAIGQKMAAIVLKLRKPKKAAFDLHRWFCAAEAAALAPYEILDKYEADQIRDYNQAAEAARLERERVISEAQRRGNEARATAEAAALEASGERELAAAVVHEAISAPAPVVVLANEVRAIQSFARHWHFRIINPALVPRAYCSPDEKKLRSHATSMKDTAQVPGVEFWYTDDPIR